MYDMDDEEMQPVERGRLVVYIDPDWQGRKVRASFGRRNIIANVILRRLDDLPVGIATFDGLEVGDYEVLAPGGPNGDWETYVTVLPNGTAEVDFRSRPKRSS